MNGFFMSYRRKKILILSHQGIGDIVTSIPIYLAVRDQYPDALICSTVKTKTEKALLLGQNLSDFFILSDYYNMSLKSKISWVYGLLFKRFDVVIAPFGINVRYAIIIKIISCSKKLYMGRKGGVANLFITDFVELRSRGKRVFNNQLIAHKFSNKKFYPVLYSCMDYKDVLVKFGVFNRSKIVGIHPGCGFLEKWKRWSPEYYSKLINKLSSEYDLCFILFGVKDEVPLCNAILSGVDEKVNVHSLCGMTSIEETLALISSCSYFVSADSGLMHMASALQVKTFSIFGPSPYWEIAPYWNNGVVITKKLDCSPCWPDLSAGCEDLTCLKELTPDIVYSAIKNEMNIQINGDQCGIP